MLLLPVSELLCDSSIALRLPSSVSLVTVSDAYRPHFSHSPTQTGRATQQSLHSPLIATSPLLSERFCLRPLFSHLPLPPPLSLAPSPLSSAMGNRQSGRVDGQPFLASDHVAVPVNEPVVDRGPFHPLINVLQTYPRILLAMIVLLLVLLIVAIAMLALIAQTRNECDKKNNGGGSGSNSCGYDNKDLSSLSYDLTKSQDGFQYWLRPCGTVSNGVCSDLYGGNSQSCTRQVSTGDVVDNGDWVGSNGANGAWSSYNGNGLQYHTSNGDQCGNTFRSLYVYYSCQNGVTPYIDQVVQSTCATHFFVNTQLVC